QGVPLFLVIRKIQLVIECVIKIARHIENTIWDIIPNESSFAQLCQIGLFRLISLDNALRVGCLNMRCAIKRFFGLIIKDNRSVWNISAICKPMKTAQTFSSGFRELTISSKCFVAQILVIPHLQSFFTQ
ncbi:MAG: hypothetical protein J5449_06290, partial [Oscillospiraceae bacterium]|nr:hypothetical protein [Oscillospiraceae bacterium]